MTGVQILSYTASFPDVGHDVLNIIHVLFSGFVICVELCSTMRFLADSACSVTVLIKLFMVMLFEQWIITINVGGWKLIYMCFRLFVLERNIFVVSSASCGA